MLKTVGSPFFYIGIVLAIFQPEGDTHAPDCIVEFLQNFTLQVEFDEVVVFNSVSPAVLVLV